MARMKLAGGVVVRTFPKTTRTLNPVEAEDRELIRRGFPPRPRQEDLLRRWVQEMGRPLRVIQPEFRLADYKIHHVLGSRADRHAVETNTIWSGVVGFAPAGSTVTWVEGTWTQPDVHLPGGFSDGTWYTASGWVGIDGDGSGDVLQAGCDSDIISSGGTVMKQFNPWWEWFPAGSVWIMSNFPVSPGDTLNCVICVSSSTDATIYLRNVTTGLATSFSATPPPNVSLVGNSAEWIVEALPDLARYGQVFFSDCHAGTSQGGLLNLANADTIDIAVGGQTLSVGSYEGNDIVKVTYTGQ
jgi:peptidase A4-like protein